MQPVNTVDCNVSELHLQLSERQKIRKWQAFQFILNLIKTDKIEMTFILAIKNQQESGILEQNKYDFEIPAISILLISQRAVKA